MSKDIFLTVEVEATQSLPLWVSDGEILFFYKTEKQDVGFKITEVTRVFKKDLQSGEYVDDSERAIVSAEAIKDNRIVSTLLGEDAFNAVENYHSLYGKFKDFAYKPGEKNEQEKAIMKNLLNCFEQLVPPSYLRDLYYQYGKEMFDYINNYIQ